MKDNNPSGMPRRASIIAQIKEGGTKSRAIKFVLLIGIVSFFADFTYEGSRSITGPFLATLGASGAIVGIVAGLGELLGYGLRVISGRLSDKTGEFWPITLFGYAIQMIAVPLLALSGSWIVAALLIMIERIGKATRNPPRDVMLSHAGKEMGYGTVFGIHEALDQSGALFGPLIVALVLLFRHNFRMGFAVLLIPALITYGMLLLAHWSYPRPEEMESTPPNLETHGLPKVFWVYLAGAALVAAGFADFSLIAFHFHKTHTVPNNLIPIFYSVAMAASGVGSYVLGRLYDHIGISILIPLTLITTLFAPLAFLGGIWVAVIGCALWGIGMGVHESIIPAIVASMVPIQRRASAYGLFTAGYGISWFIGSIIIGILYDISIPALIIFSVVIEFTAIPLFIWVKLHHTDIQSA